MILLKIGAVIVGLIVLVCLLWGLCAAGSMADRAHLGGMVDDGEDWP